MTVPNALTALRAVLVAPVIWLAAAGEPVAALSVFLAAASTDILDGTLARRIGQATALGTFLDPLADKVLVVGTLGALALLGAAPPWAVAVIAGRELLAVDIRARSPHIGATADGKAKTVLQVAATAALLAAVAWPSPALAAGAGALLLAAVALTVVSGVMLVLRAA
jgi:CDP-diacylglycerol--glycerol-3-phosphate 3-phosphatidyltransferase